MTYYYASRERVPYSWPVRYKTERPVFHFKRAGSLSTECGAVVSGPSWVVLAPDQVPAGAEYCPCSDCPVCDGSGELGRWLGSPGGDYETWECWSCCGTGEKNPASSLDTEED